MKHVKENDLAHGEFGKWLENLNLDWNTANRFMKVSSELPYSDTYHNLDSNVLYLITNLPERTKEHTTSSGETKTPDEMTVRELRELKKQLKQRDAFIGGSLFLFITCQNFTFHKVTNGLKSTLVSSTLK